MDLIRTTGANTAFRELIKDLDKELWETYSSKMKFYEKKNIVEDNVSVVVLMDNDVPVGCGALRPLSNINGIELKRMFVSPEYRGKGFSKIIVNELISWAKELGFSRILLETAYKQIIAVKLYTKIGFSVIENYGEYKGIKESICMEMILSS